ncbi:alpha-galactosidase [Lacticaseibacillus saniviri]|uniref:Alpha-galactosidase n=1 Tax=Lacticaseibacillus saniviri JCM 17471 = DSM 24301 TaxID=1293598 RepID=A0A0R2MS98_9LACO|nr:alpha-galactosidase [Lacticaseibacillus saniviri]KRO16455.1 alpha-galactosidase [Lacticaseibacillus saniviri JCM 17471 = DSM 24301]MCG4282026.1 alpha-galactosidase [Lacticaseibacillus saniviri]
MITFDDNNRCFHLTNQQISYVMRVSELDVLTHVYFGAAVPFVGGLRQYPHVDRSFSPNYAAAKSRAYSMDTQPLEYPTGNGDFREAAMLLTQANGAQYLDLHYVDYEIIAGKPALEGLPATFATPQRSAETLNIVMRDAANQIDVILSYSIFADLPIVTRSAKVINRGEQMVTLNRALSASVDYPMDDWEVLNLIGGWSKERSISRHPVTMGEFVIDSKRGTSSHQHNPFIALLHPATTEDQGEVYGYNLVYSGNHQMRVEEDQLGAVRVQAGINDFHFNWQLQPDASFQTPEVVMAYSNHGLNGMSHAYHTLYTDNLMTSRFAHEERPTLINNWEATFFDFTSDSLKPIIDQAANLGIEMFVLDDGWFGHRDNDNNSLGDWFEFKGKIAGGLGHFAQYVHQRGLKFGLWFEPEMVSADSELYHKHPDWAFAVPGNTPLVGRDQYVLDFSRQDVRDFIEDEITAVLDQVQIDYIKWDMNRSLTDVFTQSLPADRQGEVYHRYVLGLYQMLNHLTKRYPDILFESCSGGGGRFDPGMLYYMPQTWTSDNTDAVDRLNIQYGTSLVYPPVAMGSHVSAVPNSQNGRETSLEMRAAVAMGGNFGYELDLNQLSDGERAQVKEQVAFYKQHRHLIQFGTFYRLRSPFDQGNLVSWGMVDAKQREAIYFVYTLSARANADLQVIKFAGLDPNTRYRVSGMPDVYSGAELMQIGFYLDPAAYRGDYNQRIYTVNAVEEKA